MKNYRVTVELRRVVYMEVFREVRASTSNEARQKVQSEISNHKWRDWTFEEAASETEDVSVSEVEEVKDD